MSVQGQTPGATNPAEDLKVQQRFEMPVDGKLDILGLSKDELKTVLAEAGVPLKQVNMRTTQVWGWVYHKGVTDFDDMKNINKEVKEVLKAKLRISRPTITEAQYSKDGTRKYLFEDFYLILRGE